MTIAKRVTKPVPPKRPAKPAAPKKAEAAPKKAPAAKPSTTTAAKARKVAAAEPPERAKAKTPKRAAAPKAPPAPPRKEPAVALGAGAPAVLEEMRELSAQLDRLIDEASRPDLSVEAVAPAPPPPSEAPATEPDPEPPVAAAPVPEPEPPAAEPEPLPPPSARVPFARPSGPLPSVAPGEATVFDTARELLSSDYYLRKWGRLAMRNRSEEVDDFGYDPIYDEKIRPALDFLYARYFRVEARGVDQVPRAGRCLLVANHSGTVPLDGVMIKTALRREHPEARHVRWLTEDFIYHFPYLGGAMNRLGAVRACQENAERLLAKDELVAVFPEGVKGIGKLFAQRYRLQRFGRGGFVKLGLRTRTPIVPVAVVGAEEANPMVFRIEHLAKLVGLPYVPVTPTFPLLGPAGLLPAPTKWKMVFGEPLDLSSYGPEAADDELLVGRLAERVRATIQGMLDREIGARKSVFFG